MKETTLNPLGCALLILLAVVVLLVPRRHAIIPYLLMGCFVSQAQNVVIAGLSFYLLRTLSFVGVIRCFARGEYRGLRWNSMDGVVLAWSIASTTVYMIQWGTAGLITKLGWFCDNALLYYLFRCLVRDLADVRHFATAMVAISVPVTLFFLIERATGRNLFAFFGGVPEITEVREGRLRCQGAFAHPILAGCFWASVLPLVCALWWRPRVSRLVVATGLVCCFVLVMLCASSTPAVAILAAVVAGAIYRVRRHLRIIRWISVAILVMLHLVMKAPVWALIGRVDVVGGSTGDHRYRLLNAAIEHFGEWWLLGTPSTSHWGYGMQDVTNQYIIEGVRGGAISLCLFVTVFCLAFQKVGRLCRSSADETDRRLCWAMGVTNFVHCVNFVAVGYFGQITMLLFLQLAMVAGVRSRRVCSADGRATENYISSLPNSVSICGHGYVNAVQ